MKVLEGIKKPQDIKKLDTPSKIKLCEEVRKYILETVALNGGHLSSNLGSVELTVALLSVYNPPSDKIIFDVGHQSYAYKILTDRKEAFKTLRQKNGISGFPKKNESPYDCGTGGHASSSISLGVGVSSAKHLNSKNSNVVAIIGDGSLTGGLAFEGLNNISKENRNLTIIINDNEMSISENVGAFSRHLSDLRSSSAYLNTKEDIKSALKKMPVVGKPIQKVLVKSRDAVKKAIYKNSYFTDMGLDYYGPVDGHDIEKLIGVLTAAKNNGAPTVVHIITKKGKGYKPSETNPKKFHGVSSFDVKTGKTPASSDSFSKEFGNFILEKANENNRICAITAAMADGTGLEPFMKAIPERFFDVGIAEEHLAVFSAGLALEKMMPVSAIYSAFLIRATDEIINDLCIEKNHVVFGVDRAGFVGEDGETHNGLFDVSIFSSVPNTEIYAPSNYNELKGMLSEAIDNSDKVCFVRYPKGKEDEYLKDYPYSANNFDHIKNNSKTVVITYGRTFSEVLKASQKAEFDIVKLNKLSSYKELPLVLKGYKKAIFFEEGMKTGSIAEKLGSNILENSINIKYKIVAVEDEFVPQMKVKEALEYYNLNEAGVLKVVEEF